MIKTEVPTFRHCDRFMLHTNGLKGRVLRPLRAQARARSLLCFHVSHFPSWEEEWALVWLGLDF
jgi:hypothetical protein